MGGATLYIETVVDRLSPATGSDGAAAPSAASLKTTGKMGDVMKASNAILSCACSSPSHTGEYRHCAYLRQKVPGHCGS